MEVTIDDRTTCRVNESAEGIHSADKALTVIAPCPGWKLIDFPEMWRFRELLLFLVWRDVMVRYKQTILGAAWAILQPLATMIVFTIFFGRVAKMPTGGFAYPVFVIAGLLPWFFFSNAIASAGQCVVANQTLITKVYFPRLFIPMGAVLAALVDLLIAFGLLAAMMFFYGIVPGKTLLVAPVVVVGLVVASLGVGTLLSALTVSYRDFRHVIPFLVQLWMFATPAIYMYGEETFGTVMRAVLPLNPAYGLIVNFRAALLGTPLDVYALIVSGTVSLLLLVAGSMYFRRVERTFADVI